MKYYPVFLDLKKRKCLVVGGGRVGLRKALMLHRCGGDVHVISPEFCEGFHRENACEIQRIKRAYAPGDMAGCFMVFAATPNDGINKDIILEAKQRNILCNSADDPGSADFILPAVVNRGDLICALSTSGASPALAKKLKKDLENLFGPEYEIFLTLMGRIRKRLLDEGHDPDAHKKIFSTLVQKRIPEKISKGEIEAIDAELTTLLGKEFSFHDLVSHG